MKLAELVLQTDRKFPTTKAEDWQFTDVSFLQEIDWQLGSEMPAPAELDIANEPDHVYFVNGKIISSNISIPIAVTSQEKFLIPDQDCSYFSELNLATQPITLVITIPDNYRSSQPLYLEYLVTDHQLLAQARTSIYLGKNSHLRLVELFSSSADTYLQNHVLKICLGENAQLEHLRWQNEARSSTHIATTIVEQATNSRYQGINIDLGAKLARYQPIIYTQGENTDTQLFGLAIIRHKQLIDTHSSINHLYPNGTSRQTHKAIIGDGGQGVFNGRIFVSKLAQHTDSAQLSRTLLLSPNAKINTKPQLEIIADNVKCKHGATVSQLNPEEMFYLQSRGISTPDAWQLLTYSFTAEIVQAITDPQLQTRLTPQLRNALRALHTTAQG